MKSVLLFALQLALHVAAYTDSSPAIGGGPGPVPDAALFTAAGRHPNDTSSVTFQRPSGTWTWRVNITDVSVPDNTTTSTVKNLTDPRVVNVQWDLRWPGNGSLADAILLDNNGRSMADPEQLCVVMIGGTWGPNITSNYSASDNGDCSNVLGSQCAQSVMSHLGGSVGTCPTADLSNLEGCNSTLSTSRGPGQLSFALGNATHVPESAQNLTLQQGDAFAFSSYSATNGTNTTSYETASAQLQMLVLQDANGANLLCQVVNTTLAKAEKSGARSAAAMQAISLAIGAAGLGALYNLL